jgi:micrococcal nuclease
MRRKSFLLALIILLQPFIALPITGDFTIDGIVVGIVDGDTIDVLKDKQVFRIRILDMDAPEKGQPFGKPAKNLMAELVFQKTVHCVWKSKDRYGRFLATVKCQGQDVALVMIQKGMAWKYYDCINANYLNAMNQAKAKRIGLWQDKRSMDPHDWRKLSKEQRDLYR